MGSRRPARTARSKKAPTVSRVRKKPTNARMLKLAMLLKRPEMFEKHFESDDDDEGEGESGEDRPDHCFQVSLSLFDTMSDAQQQTLSPLERVCNDVIHLIFSQLHDRESGNNDDVLMLALTSKTMMLRYYHLQSLKMKFAKRIPSEAHVEMLYFTSLPAEIGSEAQRIYLPGQQYRSLSEREKLTRRLASWSSPRYRFCDYCTKLVSRDKKWWREFAKVLEKQAGPDDDYGMDGKKRKRSGSMIPRAKILDWCKDDFDDCEKSRRRRLVLCPAHV